MPTAFYGSSGVDLTEVNRRMGALADDIDNLKKKLLSEPGEADLTEVNEKLDGLTDTVSALEIAIAEVLTWDADVKADRDKVILTDGTTVFTPVNDNDPANKLYVDRMIGDVGSMLDKINRVVI